MAKHKKRANSTTRFAGRVTLASIMAAVVVLCLFITANSFLQLPYFPTWDSLFASVGLAPASVPSDHLRVTVLDVGNADCILLQAGEHAALIDAGERDDSADILAALNSHGVKKLDYVIATHPDADHIGSMESVIRNFTIDTFLMSFMPEGYEPTTKTYEKMLMALVERDVEVTEAEHGQTYAFGDATITILSGLSDYTETNDQSVVCLVSHGEMDFLFTGDAGKEVEREILKAIPTLEAEVIKVGHHGSHTSSDTSFIRAVSPEIAVITCGYGNSYNHPHAETTTLLRNQNVSVYRTDLNGRITLLSDGKTITVETEKGDR